MKYDKAFEAIYSFLKECGWVVDKHSYTETCLFFLDPKTGLTHRSDFAFFIQVERDFNRRLDMFNK